MNKYIAIKQLDKYTPSLYNILYHIDNNNPSNKDLYPGPLAIFISNRYLRLFAK